MHIKHVSNVIPIFFIIYLRLPRANQKTVALWNSTIWSRKARRSSSESWRVWCRTLNPGKVSVFVSICLLCYTPLLKIFHSHGEVTFASKGPQNLGLYDWHLRLAIMAGSLSYHNAVTQAIRFLHCENAVSVIMHQTVNRVPLFK